MSEAELSQLSPAQQELMELFWEHPELSASEVRELLSADRELARNTVRTLLERMEQKGWLTHRLEGRTHRYRATVARQQGIGHRVNEVIRNFCGGSPETLVNAMLEHNQLTDGELDRIRNMINKVRRERSGRNSQ